MRNVLCSELAVHKEFDPLNHFNLPSRNITTRQDLPTVISGARTVRIQYNIMLCYTYTVC